MLDCYCMVESESNYHIRILLKIEYIDIYSGELLRYSVGIQIMLIQILL